MDCNLETVQRTRHSVHIGNAENMSAVPDDSVDLVVTSPPYPMIAMWDVLFGSWDNEVAHHLAVNEGQAAFECMHLCLDRVWRELARVAKKGAIICVNIGDATRTIGGVFNLYPNHARVLSGLVSAGLMPLPDILWRKQSNAPNKFMGSGVLPGGAYVTLEHEYILITRKTEKRTFRLDSEKKKRRESAIFWEERNSWYSDVWTDLKGTDQSITGGRHRDRSAAYPFELAYRLINMYSVKEDVVLDPFLGTGTTSQAAVAAARNSIGFEKESGLRDVIPETLRSGVAIGQKRVARRLSDHRKFVLDHNADTGQLRHENTHYGFPVKTSQETDLFFDVPQSIAATESNSYEAQYLQPGDLTGFTPVESLTPQ